MITSQLKVDRLISWTDLMEGHVRGKVSSRLYNHIDMDIFMPLWGEIWDDIGAVVEEHTLTTMNIAHP